MPSRGMWPSGATFSLPKFGVIVGIVILMGIKRLPRINNYWSGDSFIGVPGMNQYMSVTRHSARARHSPLCGSTSRDGETPLRLPRSQQHSLYRCSERHLTGSPLFKSPDNSDFDVRGSAQVMEEKAGYKVRRCLFPYSDTPA